MHGSRDGPELSTVIYCQLSTELGPLKASLWHWSDPRNRKPEWAKCCGI